MLIDYLGKLKIQFFCRYSADMDENANKLHFCSDFNSSTRVTVYAECICVNEISEILSIRRHRYFLFTARSADAWPPVNNACLPTSSAAYEHHAFLRNLFAVCSFKYIFFKILSSSLNTMLIVDKHCSYVCCDEFSVPQIDRKSKQVKEQWHGKFSSAISIRKDSLF